LIRSKNQPNDIDDLPPGGFVILTPLFFLAASPAFSIIFPS